MLCPTSKPGLRQTSTLQSAKDLPPTHNQLSGFIKLASNPFGYEVIRFCAHGAALWTRAVILTAKPR